MIHSPWQDLYYIINWVGWVSCIVSNTRGKFTSSTPCLRLFERVTVFRDNFIISVLNLDLQTEVCSWKSVCFSCLGTFLRHISCVVVTQLEDDWDVGHLPEWFLTCDLIRRNESSTDPDSHICEVTIKKRKVRIWTYFPLVGSQRIICKWLRTTRDPWDNDGPHPVLS